MKRRHLVELEDLPWWPCAFRDAATDYLVTARHPLDMAVSLYHQGDNLDRERIRELTGAPAPSEPASRPPRREWLSAWINSDANPREFMDSLPGVLWPADTLQQGGPPATAGTPHP